MSTKTCASKSPKLLSEGSCDLIHYFNKNDNDKDIVSIRQKLLKWYHTNKRSLPWRTIASRTTEIDDDVRGYSVWVSEIMLQQTQVSTVIEYYNNWMRKWPTIEKLSEATLEDVHKVWSGLGYYSRGQRLLEGAKKVHALDGHMPRTAKELQERLPGVGRYTAAAIASIAFNEKVGLVDGNVARVFTRLCRIGAEVESKVVSEVLWHNANTLVDDDNPGDFNQALMELGAIICTPKNPNCSTCPLSSHCLAFEEVKQQKEGNKNIFLNVKKETDLKDIEDCVTTCKLCLPKNEKYVLENGVTNYPRKGRKTSQREESTLVCILRCKSSNRYCLVQRPDTGLLANLLEFLSINLIDWSQDSKMTKALVSKYMEEYYNIKISAKQIQDLGSVFHVFSHIKQTYIVYKIEMLENEYENISIQKNKYQKMEWLTDKELKNSAISTAMKKVFKLETDKTCKPPIKKSPQVKRSFDGSVKNQTGIKQFFNAQSKS